MKLLVDESQGTAIFVGFFDSEQKLRAMRARIFDPMRLLEDSRQPALPLTYAMSSVERTP